MALFQDFPLWRSVMSEWREHVTGRFSAWFVIPLYCISLLAVVGLRPEQSEGIILLGGLLIVGSFFYSVFKAFEKTQKENADLREKNRRLGEALAERSLSRVTVEFNPENDPGCIRASEEERPPGEANCYVRIKVTAAGQVANCRGELLHVSKLHNGAWSETDLAEGSLVFKWANYGPQPIPIADGTKQYLQLFRVRKKDGLAELTTFFVPVKSKQIFSDKSGIYRIDYSVSCDNSPNVRGAIQFEYGSSWDAPKVKQLALLSTQP